MKISLGLQSVLGQIFNENKCKKDKPFSSQFRLCYVELRSENDHEPIK